MALPSSAIRVLVVDDSALVREGLRAIIASHGRLAGIEVVGEADSVARALVEARRLKPDLVLLDIRLPDGSGLEACRPILQEVPSPRVLILTSVATDELVQQAVMAGAQGYLLKEIDPTMLITAIVDAAGGKSVLASEIGERMMRLLRDSGKTTRTGLDALSLQERRILALVTEGFTNKEVAEKLNLSDNTVKNYLVTVFEKLHVKRRSQAAAIFASGDPKRRQ